jgi:hypothetical protein
MTKRKSKGAYMISAVAEMYGIHPQTSQLYEGNHGSCALASGPLLRVGDP